MSDMMGMGGMMGMGAAPEYKDQPAQVRTSRRKLNHVLQQLHLGVTGATSSGMPKTAGGLLASVAPEKQDAVKEWVEAMDIIVQAINDLSRDDEEKYLETLNEQTVALRDFLGVEAPVKFDGVPDAMAAKATAGVAADEADEFAGMGDITGPVDELGAAPAPAPAAAAAGAVAAPAPAPVDELAP